MPYPATKTVSGAESILRETISLLRGERLLLSPEPALSRQLYINEP